jgi:Mrp family chromosome partitioning ATPase
LSLAYDYVLIDSPPVLIVADALELARVVDGVIVVVRRNEATTDEARELRSTVERLGLNLLGVVFTDVMPVGAYGAYGSYSDRSPEERATVFDEEYESVAHEEF